MKRGRKKKSVEKVSTVTSDNLLDAIVNSLSGDGAQLLGSKGLAIKIRGVISTGNPAIDLAIGRGGIPLGRLTILHGKEASGKTTLALQIVAECQKKNGLVIYVDKEYKLDPDYASALGVNLEKLIIVQPSYMEKFFEMCESIINKAEAARIKTGERVPILIVLDSLNAAITKAQFDGEWEDRHISPQARVLSGLLPKLMPLVSKEDVALLFISQIRKKIGVLYGDPDEISGGNAPKFFASVIIKINSLGNITDKEEGEKGGTRIANKSRIEIVKNQISPPFKKADCKIVYGKGFDKEFSLVNAAVEKGIINKAGAWFDYEGKRLGQGFDNVVDMFKKDKDLYKEILKKIKNEGGTKIVKKNKISLSVKEQIIE